ncbi:MAG: hypothetical protein ABJF11_09925 [Reichenbachiella sp.]|uniref:hypothetical protein n=1 Tax=Reichenbachiella sp. TaxID=2184521 RepID=UPI003264304F
MQGNYKNGEEYYNKIYLLFNALIAVSLLPFGYLLLLRQTGSLQSQVPYPLNPLLVVVLILSAAALIYQSYRSFSNFVQSDKTESTLREKLNEYRSESFRKYMAYLLASLILVCGLFLTANGLFIVAYIATTILLSLKRPTLNTIIEDLQLSEEDQKVLIEKKTID